MAVAAAALALAACGGSDDSDPADAGPYRFYETQSRGRLTSLILVDGGLVYGFYQSDFSQPTLPDYVYAGFFVASPGRTGVFGVSTGQDFRFDAREAVPLTLRDVDASETLFGATLESSTGTELIGARRAFVDELPTDFSRLEGAYNGQARSVSGSRKGTAAISVTGNFLVQLPDSCRVTGELTPRPKGNLYDATAQFSPTCTVASGAMSGHAFQSYGTRNVYVLLTAQTAGAGVMLLLSTP